MVKYEPMETEPTSHNEIHPTTQTNFIDAQEKDKEETLLLESIEKVSFSPLKQPFVFRTDFRKWTDLDDKFFRVDDI